MTLKNNILLLISFRTTAKNVAGNLAGVVIGLALTMIHILTVPVTGTSVNPARSFGPALLQGGDALSQLWLFIVAPLLGAILAVLLWKYVFGKDAEASTKK